MTNLTEGEVAAKAQKAHDAETLTVALPSWTKIVGTLLSILGAIIAWEALRIVNKVDDLSTRVAVLEERIPQPLSKELAPLTEEVRKLALEFAELRGQLGGKTAAPAKPASGASE